MKLPALLQNLPPALLMDIGTGTKDVLCFTPTDTLENNIKLVVPTPASLMAEQLETWVGDLAISGYTMGGGYLAKVLRHHREKGHRICMESFPAFTVRNNLEEITASGIEVVERIDKPTHVFDEIELPLYFDLMTRFGFNPDQIKVIGVSVQDHGFHTHDESSRKNRFKYFLEHLEKAAAPRSLVFTPADLPDVFQRLKSAGLCISRFRPDLKVVLIDTSFSAILGCTFDPRVAALQGPVLYINFGNGHTMACILDSRPDEKKPSGHSNRLLSFFEHHTRILKQKPECLKDYVRRLAEGNLPSDEVFEDDGNGCVTFEKIPFEKLAGIVVTGPQRYLMARTGIGSSIEAAPGGDMMMTGPLGLLHGMALRSADFVEVPS